MDLRKLKTIFELFEGSNIQEMEITEGEEKLRLVKGDGPGSSSTAQSPQAVGTSPPVQAPAPSMAGFAGNQASSAPVPDVPAAASDGDLEVDDGMIRVEAPMVGTYYSKPGEDEDPFVKVGDKVTEGQVVCIIEAMKLFNNVNAPVSGTVESLVVDNEQPVGYGDLLMTIKPDN